MLMTTMSNLCLHASAPQRSAVRSVLCIYTHSNLDTHRRSWLLPTVVLQRQVLEYVQYNVESQHVTHANPDPYTLREKPKGLQSSLSQCQAIGL